MFLLFVSYLFFPSFFFAIPHGTPIKPKSIKVNGGLISSSSCNSVSFLFCPLKKVGRSLIIFVGISYVIYKSCETRYVANAGNIVVQITSKDSNFIFVQNRKVKNKNTSGKKSRKWRNDMHLS